MSSFPLVAFTLPQKCPIVTETAERIVPIVELFVYQGDALSLILTIIRNYELQNLRRSLFDNSLSVLAALNVPIERTRNLSVA
jgi:hypothetical protein